jgi:hypothetical protein
VPGTGDGDAIDCEGIIPVATTTTTTTPAPRDGGSSGSITLLWLSVVVLLGMARRVHRQTATENPYFTYKTLAETPAFCFARAYSNAVDSPELTVLISISE